LCVDVLPFWLQEAIFHHDVVCEPLSKINEKLSCAVYVAECYSDNDCPDDRVMRAILATKDHRKTGDHEIDSFLDADRAILGANELDYKIYLIDIRKEYSVLSDDEFKAGRLAFIDSFTGFHTKYFQDNFSENVEINFKMERGMYL
jgi:predicted metal-dependent HD superfamily phosphohydrolase